MARSFIDRLKGVPPEEVEKKKETKAKQEESAETKPALVPVQASKAQENEPEKKSNPAPESNDEPEKKSNSAPESNDEPEKKSNSTQTPNKKSEKEKPKDFYEGFFKERETNPDRAELKQEFAAAKICLAATEDVLRKAKEIGDEWGINEAKESVKKAKKRFDEVKAKAKNYAEYRTPEEIASAITSPIMKDIFNDRMAKTEEDYFNICLEEDVLSILKYIIKSNRKK